MKKKKLIIFGDSAFAQIAYEYFTFDSNYKVEAFTVSEKCITKKKMLDIPIVEFENIDLKYPPDEYEIFIALVYKNMNKIREKFYNESKEKGYKLASYVSSSAFVWRNVVLGDNVFIFENNTVQPYVRIGNNTILWSGNHIGHHSNIGNNCFISSHVVISGYCYIGDNSFLGVNATINHNITIGNECLIGSGSIISKNTNNKSLFQAKSTINHKLTTDQINF